MIEWHIIYRKWCKMDRIGVTAIQNKSIKTLEDALNEIRKCEGTITVLDVHNTEVK